jgi:hypothetical protein
VLLAHTLVGKQPRRIDCEACEEDLALYIDDVQANGQIAAARAHPTIWWHLATCPSCSELYEQISTALIEAAPASWVPPIYQHVLHLFRMARAELDQFFGLTYELGPAYGSKAETLFENSSNGYHLCLTATPYGAQSYQFALDITPPYQGTAVLSLGDLNMRASFDDKGRAQFEPIPTSLLIGQSGPDLTIGLDT